MPILEPRVAGELAAALQARRIAGRLLSPPELAGQLARFRERFGPQVLNGLQGNDLLHFMHGRGNHDSLTYWLEYKDDNELRARYFGSIKGGSGHKFGLLQRKSGQWVAGGSREETKLTEAKAVTVAETQRDQLLAGVELLNHLPVEADDDAYAELQRSMKRTAPDLYRLAWAHKYLSLLFPDKLDDLHSIQWQRHHLIKLLQLPPDAKGLYVSSGRFVAIAREQDWPLTYLTAACNERHGKPVKYWRVGTRLGYPDGERLWPAMLNGGYAAIGWPDLGDLSELREQKDASDTIRELLLETHERNPGVATKKANEIHKFLAKIAEGHVIIAGDGARVLGIGVVEGAYYHDESDPAGAPHRLPVRWVPCEDWKLPEPEGLQTTVRRIGKHEGNLVAIERQLLKLPTETKSERAVRKQARKLDVQGEFDDENEADGRERLDKSIAVRRGQPRFRADLIAAYDGKCAITGCDAVEALEAAHILPYMGAHSHHCKNGLLLRADLHTLFDLGHLQIDPDTCCVMLGPRLRGTQYEALEGLRVREPVTRAARPSPKALRKRFRRA